MKVIPAGQHTLPEGVPAAADLQALARERRAERVDAYKQLQAIAAMVADTTGLSLDNFAVPQNWNVRRVRADEERVLRGRGPAVLESAGGLSEEMPYEARVRDVPLLVLCLDQGSPGFAGVHFAVSRLKVNVFAFPDAFHRGPNDVKDATRNSCGGVLRRAMLHGTFLFNLNYGPFGSGAWFREKRAVLNAFLAEESPSSAIFLDFAERIGDDLELPTATAEDIHQVWASLLGLDKHLAVDVCAQCILLMYTKYVYNVYDLHEVWASLAELNSFRRKGPLVKGSRWFSWWDNYVFHRPESHALQMLLLWRASHGGVSHEGARGGVSPEARRPPATASAPGAVDAEFRALRSSCGGFSLAQRVLTDKLLDEMKVLFNVTRPIWTHHSARARTMQSPTQALSYYVRQARRAWVGEEVADIVRAAFFDDDLLHGARVIDAPGLVMDFSVAVLGNRAWSYSLYSECPPFACAGAMSTTTSVRDAAVADMSRQWANLLRLERVARVSAAAKELRDDIVWADHVPIRLLYMFFERDGWSAESVSGQRFLRALLQHLPDSRVVEQTHRYVRLDCEGRNTNRSTRVARLVASVDNPVLKQHGVPEVSVGEEVFLRHFRDRSVPDLSRRSFEAPPESLPQRWAEVLRPQRTWPSPTPLSSRRSIAAWSWLHHYFREVTARGEGRRESERCLVWGCGGGGKTL